MIPKALLISEIFFKARGWALFVITCVVNFSPETLTPRVTVIYSLLHLTPWPSELTVQYDLDDIMQCCKANSSMSIMHSSGTSISILQISCKCFSTCMGLMLLCSLHLFLVDVEMHFKYFSSHPFDATNVWRETISDGFKHSAKSCKILTQKTEPCSWAPLQSCSVGVHWSQHAYAIDAPCL